MELITRESETAEWWGRFNTPRHRADDVAGRIRDRIRDALLPLGRQPSPDEMEAAILAARGDRLGWTTLTLCSSCGGRQASAARVFEGEDVVIDLCLPCVLGAARLFPPDGPLAEFALAALRGDPQALDAIKDTLARGGVRQS